MKKLGEKFFLCSVERLMGMKVSFEKTYRKIFFMLCRKTYGYLLKKLGGKFFYFLCYVERLKDS